MMYLQEWKALKAKYPRKLSGWTLVLDHRPKRRFGQCRYVQKEVALSAWLIDLNGESHSSVIDTLRHEAAHAIVGPYTGHGPKWKAMCTALGAIPSSTSKDTNLKSHPKRVRLSTGDK